MWKQELPTSDTVLLLDTRFVSLDLFSHASTPERPFVAVPVPEFWDAVVHVATDRPDRYSLFMKCGLTVALRFQSLGDAKTALAGGAADPFIPEIVKVTPWFAVCVTGNAGNRAKGEGLLGENVQHVGVPRRFFMHGDRIADSKHRFVLSE
jgi:hypothetical protein